MKLRGATQAKAILDLKVQAKAIQDLQCGIIYFKFNVCWVLLLSKSNCIVLRVISKNCQKGEIVRPKSYVTTFNACQAKISEEGFAIATVASKDRSHPDFMAEFETN